ncbi:hypothetical protein N7535_002198 [Penicillium sp. DV-2018c]|nr:hypothetical protein N7461_004557 [Penicillium sp. DV-2018c]KAJ5583578.1 hypothetical protein N7535_002198 [Penicillium sp. DV-2018c]
MNYKWLVGVTSANRIDRTSLSVNVRKAAERGEAQLDGRGIRSNVSVCERAEGSGTCVDSTGWRRG